jgi:hypothetical protein
MTNIRLAALMIALTFCPLSQSGIIYSKTVDGDFPVAVNPPMTTFNLTAGTNTISGNSGNSDFDGFGFNVPAGHSLTALSWSYTKNGVISTYEWTVYSGSNIPFGGTALGNLTLSTATFTGVPLAPGLYSVLDSLGIVVNSFSINYTFSAEITANPGGQGVPEPGTMGMMACGLGMLGALRLRRG